ncbi:glutamate-1-semialdehyde 2,1-aminomutase [Alkalitalea saponilacus]|uniref:Glutamate-1-semialdehyde 2,1-aminomutase n=1 Tax=Alkalitalea saponilacus TaxID=889453 RepID=A0A1T5HSX4_9BACT|nr:glutamate-1-semialdehyde 2,1-aminomutase [Alkalitalea saponilacus]ASB47695.1 glutamate-1-semialdehyde-2,1-aminomutase [Alkalitalea saponilacus]SKC23620.1 glutamate-1-semialdehyde 2,1-aminomutase [Alkalitalea saponilacus]
MRNINKSISAFKKSLELLPGGVNSPVRAFKSVGGNPLFIDKAKGSKVWDIDGNCYTDFVASWGPMILGHAREEIVEAIQKAAKKGTSYGAPTLAENEMAELITSMVPSVEKVRMVNSGTEATMSALRLARGFTGKDKVVKFAGCFHGHADSFLIKAGSGAMTLGLPDSPGVTKAAAADTLTAEYNDLDSVEALFSEYGSEIAAVIVEPVPGNMGVILPKPGFLEGLRDLTNRHDALLIFDEVITGFRLAPGGAQERMGVIPDLTTMGKIIGGGLPVGAYGGRKEIMDMLAPNGPVYQAGTLSGNPLAMAAGSQMLQILNDNPSIYNELERKAARLEEGLRERLKETGTPGVINRIGSMMTLFFTELAEVNGFNDAMTSDTEKYARHFNASLDKGIYFAPSAFECTFISDAHTDEDIEKVIQAFA